MDPYTVLGVSRGCTELDAKKEYRKLALRWHPDKVGPRGTEKMKEINGAHEKLLAILARGQDAKSYAGGADDRRDRTTTEQYSASEHAREAQAEKRRQQSEAARARKERREAEAAEEARRKEAAERMRRAEAERAEKARAERERQQKETAQSETEKRLEKLRLAWLDVEMQRIYDPRTTMPAFGFADRWQQFITSSEGVKYRAVWTHARCGRGTLDETLSNEHFRTVIQAFESYFFTNEPNLSSVKCEALQDFVRFRMIAFDNEGEQLLRSLYGIWQDGQDLNQVWFGLSQIFAYLKAFKLRYRWMLTLREVARIHTWTLMDLIELTGVPVWPGHFCFAFTDAGFRSCTDVDDRPEPNPEDVEMKDANLDNSDDSDGIT